MTDEPKNRDTLLAGFYALYLRELGYSPDEAAELVARRYPRVRWRLLQLISREQIEEHRAAAAAAAGGAS